VSGPAAYALTVLYTLPGLVFGLILHELVHSALALRFGDPSPHRDRRMSLDPRRQLDAFGFAAMLLAGIGWGRPVHLDPIHLRATSQRIAVAIAGPLTHLVVAAIFAIALRVELLGSNIDIGGFVTLAQSSAQAILCGVLLQGFLVNIALFVFNALPLPGLDGYAALRSALFARAPRLFLSVEQNRYLVYVAVISLAVLLPQLTAGRVNPLGAATVGTATLLFEHLVVPGVTPLFIGLPNIFMLFS
jgi:Zn-dependent protease